MGLSVTTQGQNMNDKGSSALIKILNDTDANQIVNKKPVVFRKAKWCNVNDVSSFSWSVCTTNTD